MKHARITNYETSYDHDRVHPQKYLKEGSATSSLKSSICWLTAFLLPKESLKDNKHWKGHEGRSLTTSNHKKTRKDKFKSYHKIVIY